MDIEEIIRRIGIIRNNANLSQRELSLKIGKNAGYINRLESKNSFEPTVTALLDIIEACGSTPEEFFYPNFGSYKLDSMLADYMKKLTDKQKKAIMNLYEI